MIKKQVNYRFQHPFFVFILAVIVGIISSLSVVVFRELILATRYLIFGSSSQMMFVIGNKILWWIFLIIISVGGILISLVTTYFLKAKHPPGLAEIIRNQKDEQSFSIKEGLGGAIVNFFSIAIGASVGREGPAIHLATSISVWFTDICRLTHKNLKLLLCCAIASALASSFNTPIAGIIFAFELLSFPVALLSLFPIALASAGGTFITRIIYGDFPAFIIPHYELGGFKTFPLYILLGIFAGFISSGFMYSMTGLSHLTLKTLLPGWFLAAIAGAIVAGIGFYYPQVLGIGYQTIDSILIEPSPLIFLLYLFIAKFLATALCIGSGFGGGILTPSLFLGAVFGTLFGVIVQYILPEATIDYRTYTLTCMAAITGAVLGTPLALVIIIFELTKDYLLALNVLFACMFSYFISLKLFGTSFFHHRLIKKL